MYSLISYQPTQARVLFFYVPAIILKLHIVVNVIVSLIYVNRTLANDLAVIYEWIMLLWVAGYI